MPKQVPVAAQWVVKDHTEPLPALRGAREQDLSNSSWEYLLITLLARALHFSAASFDLHDYVKVSEILPFLFLLFLHCQWNALANARVCLDGLSRRRKDQWRTK